MGEYRTFVSYPLVIAVTYYASYLLGTPHSGSRVEGEMYVTDDATLANLHRLEHVGSSHYAPLVVPVVSCKDRATVVHAFVYFKTNSLDELVKSRFHNEYQPQRYIPYHLRQLHFLSSRSIFCNILRLISSRSISLSLGQGVPFNF